MARIRTIKPEFWEHEGVAALDLGARLLFIALWNFADDEGLLRWNAVWLASRAFPYDLDAGTVTVDDVQSWMDSLEKAGLVHAYVAPNRQRYGWIISFLRHQKINRPTPSKLPAPSLKDPRTVIAYGERDNWMCAVCCEPITACSDSLTESLTEPLPVSLQRTVGRSAGGGDHPDNVKMVHSRCSIANDVESFAGEALVSAAHTLAGVVKLASVNDSLSHSVNGSHLEVEREVEREEEPPPAEGVSGEEAPRADAPGAAVALFEAPAPPSKPKRATGTRLDLSWKPSPDTMAWSLDQGRQVGLDITREWAKFQDYWLARAGAGGRKVDWDATWRNWIRKAVEYSPQRKAPFPHMGTTSRKIANTQALKELFK